MVDTQTAPTDPLPESKLGTKEHWDQVYEREVKNFEDIGDEGEIWFGEDAVDRMVRYVEQYCEESLSPEAVQELTALDLGTGNGHLLFSLLEAEIDPPLDATLMKGVDYSPASIELANAIAKQRDDERCQSVRFEVSDLLRDEDVVKLRDSAPSKDASNSSSSGWHLVCDKGTYDAIALSSQPIDGKLPVDLYRIAVEKLTRPNGIFLITSCNFTEQELVTKFAGGTDAPFTVEKVVPTPQFSFGGKKGSTTTTISFRRRSS